MCTALWRGRFSSDDGDVVVVVVARRMAASRFKEYNGHVVKLLGRLTDADRRDATRASGDVVLVVGSAAIPLLKGKGETRRKREGG